MASYIVTARYTTSERHYLKYSEACDNFESAVKLFIDIDHVRDYHCVRMFRLEPNLQYDGLNVEEVSRGEIYEFAWKNRL